ncbi:SPOSA6832_03290, partial [Sporobolomyces salmonicolor]
VALLCVSDTAFADPSSDRSLPALRNLLTSQPDGAYSIVASSIVGDEEGEIARMVGQWVAEGIDLVLTSGGTGFGTRDKTPEVRPRLLKAGQAKLTSLSTQAVAPLIDKPAPGLVTSMLLGSLQITPLAALSRPVAGVALSPRPDVNGAGTLIVTLPGSPKAATENLENLLRVLPHALELSGGARSRTTQVHQRLEKGEDGMAGVQDVLKEHGREHSHLHHHHHHHHHHHSHAAPRPRTLLSQDPSFAIASRQRHSPWPLISVRDALALIFEHTPSSPVQTLPVEPSLVGHVIADDVYSARDLPSAPSTNIDGYAVRCEAAFSFSPRAHSLTLPLDLAATDAAGVYKVVTTFPASPLPAGSVYRINTGAPLPPGMDACIMVEDTEVVSRDESGEETEVKLLAQMNKGENVRKEGSDVRTGEKVLEKGDVISNVGGELGTLAFIGKRSVPVYRRPTVAVLSTGNELVDLLDTTTRPTCSFSSILDSNRPTLLSVLQNLHYPTLDLGICTDSMEATKAALKKGKEEADVVITTGGTSMGVGDLLKPCIERELGGTVHFGRVAMKPGKPTTFATVPAHPFAPNQSPKLVFALPGNPASALVTFFLFVLPALRKMEGRRESEWELPRVPVTLTSTVALDPRAEYHRVHVRPTATGLKAFSTGGQRSSRAVSLAGANGLLELPAKTETDGERKEGDLVPCVLIGEMGSLLA